MGGEMRALVMLWALSAPVGAWAGVDGLGAMIREGYQEQAATYREFQKALRGEVTQSHEAKARDLEALSDEGELSAGPEMGVRLVKVEE